MSIGYQITLEGGVRINVDTHERALELVKGMSDDEYHIDVLENDSDTISVPEGNVFQADSNDVLTTAWIDDTLGTSGCWYADIANTNIQSTSHVSVTPTIATEAVYNTAGAVSVNTPNAGSVRIYARTQPAATVTFNLLIVK